MTSSTSGPWHTSSTHSGAAFDIGAANGANVALVSGPAENGADEFKANARLISAAPDLLAALELCLRYMDGPRAPSYLKEPIRAAKTAIAAAKGGA